MTPVKFSVVETKYSHDNSPCGDYRESLNAAINYAIGENSRILRKCGYKFEYITDYFDINNPLSAKEAGEDAERKKSWFVIGPRRSDLFLVLTKELKFTPAISLMAGSDRIKKIQIPAFTVASPDDDCGDGLANSKTNGL